jgi:peptide-methionine (S)-S-oxide reductase
VGYSGGSKKNPTYYNLGDHTETFQVDFDPTRVTYEQLLDIFWASHRPDERSWSRQYLKAIFYHNEEQKRLAEASRDKVAAKIRGQVSTPILPATEFYLAEDYHQKYALRRGAPELAREYAAIYPRLEDFVNSTAVTRVNGYLGGFGTPEVFNAEVDRLGLSPAGRDKLLALTRFRWERAKAIPAVPSGACPL